MSTTQVFAELLITGFGGLTWIIIMICSMCGFDLSYILDQNYSTIFIIPLSGFAYILGILIDRLGYQIFIKYEKQNIPKVFYSSNKYPKDNKGDVYPKPIITYIMHKSKHLNKQMIYNRTRLRLSRSWVLNFLFIALAFFIYALNRDVNNCKVIYVLSGLSFILCIYAFFIWKTLARDYYKNIKSSYDLLKKVSG